MNNKVKFLELVLADLVSVRDTLEMDLNEVLNTWISLKQCYEKCYEAMSSINNTF